MKRQVVNPAPINTIADGVTRRASEKEDIDLAAEATASVPAKTLSVRSKSRQASAHARGQSAKR